MLEIDENNINYQLLEAIKQKIKNSSFIAMDCEFFRVTTQDSMENFFSLADEYCVKKDLVKSSVLSQFGLTTFKEEINSENKETLVMSNFSFYMMKDKARRTTYTFENGCLNFLANNKFDFLRTFRDGIDNQLLDFGDFKRNIEEGNENFTFSRPKDKPNNIEFSEVNNLEDLQNYYSINQTKWLMENSDFNKSIVISDELMRLENVLLQMIEKDFQNEEVKVKQYFLTKENAIYKKLMRKFNKIEDELLKEYLTLLKNLKAQGKEINMFFNSRLSYIRQKCKKQFHIGVMPFKIVINRKMPAKKEDMIKKNKYEKKFSSVCKINKKNYLSIIFYTICLYKKPIIFHNGFFDVLYIHHNLFKELPDNILDLIKIQNQYWPKIYCTKNITIYMHKMRTKNGLDLKVKRNRSKTMISRLYKKFVEKSFLKKIILESDYMEAVEDKQQFRNLDVFANPETYEFSHSAGYDSMITAILFYSLKEYLCYQLKEQFYEIKKKKLFETGEIKMNDSIDEWVYQLIEYNLANIMFGKRNGGVNFNLPFNNLEEKMILHNMDYIDKSLFIKFKELEEFHKIKEVLDKHGNYFIQRVQKNLIMITFKSNITNDMFEFITNSQKESAIQIVKYIDRKSILI